MKKRLVLILLTIFAFNVHAHDQAATNKDGSIVTGILTAGFDPFASARGENVLPFPSSLLYFTRGFQLIDMTLDIPAEDPSNTGDPAVALSALDGFSTTEKWVTSFYNGLEDGNYR